VNMGSKRHTFELHLAMRAFMLHKGRKCLVSGSESILRRGARSE